jgi:N-acetyl sugar amidotransferase
MIHNMRNCKKCLFPDTRPDLYFDEKGVCDACNSAEQKHSDEKGINWDQREKEFKQIIEKYRSKDGSNYDCIIPVSGGKDSTFQVYAMKVIHKMNPLAITFDQFDQVPLSQYNLEILRKIGVDHIHFTLNPNIVKKLVKKGFEIVGDPYWVNHVGMFTIPSRFAVALNIPLIIWGENSQLEYGGPAADRERKVLDKRWRQEFGCMRGFREEDMVNEEISLGDLKFLRYPSDEKIEKTGVTGLFYGYFFKWDSEKNFELVKKLGWKPLPKPWPGSWLEWENCDMKFVDVREYLKFLKFGYGRATDQTSIFIRNKRLTREEALKIIKEIDGKMTHKKEFCDYIGITEQEFDKISDTFVNTDILKKNEKGIWELKEQPN